MIHKKILVVTGTRAEYGLLKNLCLAISKSCALKLALAVTGSHLSEAHGYTKTEILADGFTIDYEVDLELGGDSSLHISGSTARSIKCFSSVLARCNPDFVMVLGDRYELLGPALAALFFETPLIHIHGGELTAGAFDNSIRHCLSKLAVIHFAAHHDYAKRLVQMGELPTSVFTVGGLGVDAISKAQLIGKRELEDSLSFVVNRNTALICFHPETLESSARADIDILLASLSDLPWLRVIFTLPNADTENEVIATKIKEFVRSRPSDAKYFESLGQQRYLSLLQFVGGVIGNSSSGLLEVPSFGIPTVNLGDRQAGRLKATSVIDCIKDRSAIVNAIKRAWSEDFRSTAKKTSNPYGSGGAVDKIIGILETVSPPSVKKEFYDLGDRFEI